MPANLRSKTVSIRAMRTQTDPRINGLIGREVQLARPKKRFQCGQQRPCPFVGCKYHLYLDVNPRSGSIQYNFPELEVWEMEQSCALDVAEQKGITLEEASDAMNMTRERIRQLESTGLAKLKRKQTNGITSDILQ